MLTLVCTPLERILQITAHLILIIINQFAVTKLINDVLDDIYVNIFSLKPLVQQKKKINK